MPNFVLSKMSHESKHFEGEFYYPWRRGGELLSAVVSYITFKEVVHGMGCLSELHLRLKFRDVISPSLTWEQLNAGAQAEERAA